MVLFAVFCLYARASAPGPIWDPGVCLAPTHTDRPCSFVKTAGERSVFSDGLRHSVAPAPPSCQAVQELALVNGGGLRGFNNDLRR